ncbi:hypothetical protein QZH41_005252, partial [Actinostola sp. cb2023]
IVAICGNSFLVHIIYTTPRMKTSFNYFIANMAVSDILVQFCSVPRLVTDLLYDTRRWLIGDTVGLVLCKLLFFVQDICTAVSIECVVLIAIDRFLAVVTPTKVRSASRGRLKVTIIVLTWIVAMLIHTPYFHFQRIRIRNDKNMYCTIDWSPWSNEVHTRYMAVLATILFFIPLGTITILYTVIFTLVKHRKIPGHVSSDRRQFRHYEKAKTNVLQLSIAVVTMFVISWAPNIIYLALLMTIWDWRVPCPMHPFRFFALLMGYANTATNPWIYFILSANYRQGIQKLINCGRKPIKDDQKRLNSSRARCTMEIHLGERWRAIQEGDGELSMWVMESYPGGRWRAIQVGDEELSRWAMKSYPGRR